MICPHCKENLLYKERGGKKCSKCRREFAFEPKTDPLGLHDARFVKAVEKISDYGKLYFTPTQLYYLLARKKITNSTNSFLGTIFGIAFVIVIGSIVVSVFTSVAYFMLFGLFAVIAAMLLAVFFWNREGNLTIPAVSMERDVFNRWSYIYRSLPPQLLSQSNALPQSGVLPAVRGVLVCLDEEVLQCLAANRINEQLGLMLFNPWRTIDEANKSRLDFVRQKRDLPVFVLHDASAEGCQLKQKFTAKYLGNDRQRAIFDIGLRPRLVMNSKLLRLRFKDKNQNPPRFENLTAEEANWLNAGNYTPLLSLAPAQLIKFVTSAVQKNLQRVPVPPPANPQKEAQNVGFMTWVGQTK